MKNNLKLIKSIDKQIDNMSSEKVSDILDSECISEIISSLREYRVRVKKKLQDDVCKL